MKVGLMAEEAPDSNDEPQRGVPLLPGDLINIPVRSRKNDPFSAIDCLF
jgi:hypothetical protein